ncbi:hypothetical protein FH972_015152 [Carpinus fangiana]|uniref:Uncharacterized protein n=1 Tax=Carpinus fangiana TaxID=176857 RepID=A0A5N6RBT2_9ROSI|nr:hypothetical protein FH972_015152 [Carpinus fangiana]
MSDDTPTTNLDGAGAGIDTSEPTHSTSAPSDSSSKTQSAIQSLSSILPSTAPPSLSSTTPKLLPKSPCSTATPTPTPAKTTCRWLYDTFQFGDPDLQLVALHFLPIIAGV